MHTSDLLRCVSPKVDRVLKSFACWELCVMTHCNGTHTECNEVMCMMSTNWSELCTMPDGSAYPCRLFMHKCTLGISYPLMHAAESPQTL